MATWPTITDDNGSNTTGTVVNNTNVWTPIQTYIGGAWTSVSFSAGNFTAGGSQTWTVASGDQNTYAYTVCGKTMTLVWWLTTTTVGGTPNAELRIAIPGGVTVSRAVWSTYNYSDNGTEGVGPCGVAASGSYVSLYKASTSSSWTASTDNTMVRGQITFEIA